MDDSQLVGTIVEPHPACKNRLGNWYLGTAPRFSRWNGFFFTKMTSKIEEEIISGKKLSELSSDQFLPGCPPVNKHIAESGEPDSVLYVDVGNTDPCQAHKPQCFKVCSSPLGAAFLCNWRMDSTCKSGFDVSKQHGCFNQASQTNPNYIWPKRNVKPTIYTKGASIVPSSKR